MDEFVWDWEIACEGGDGWACEVDVGEWGLGVIGFGKADGEGVAAFNVDGDGRWGVVDEGIDECSGGGAGSAGEGFCFDASLVGSDGDLGGGEDLDEVGVGSSRGEVGVEADGASPIFDWDVL